MRQLTYVLGILLLTLIVLSAIPGCTPVTKVTAESSAQEIGFAAVNEANATLAAAAKVIGDNVKAGIYTKEQGQRYLDKVRELARQVDEVHMLVKAGIPDAAQRAKIVQTLILELHKEVAAKARQS